MQASDAVITFPFLISTGRDVGTVTLIVFTSFATVQGSDYVDIYDGATTSAPRIGHFSGHSLPPAVTSSTGTMLVRFTTASTQTDQGWEATYSTGYNDNDYLEYSDGTKTIVVGCNPNVTSVRVPGRVVKIASRAFEGCNHLIRDNQAGLITSAEDFVMAMGWQDDAALSAAQQQGIERQLFPQLNETEARIVAALQKQNDQQINLLTVRTDLPISKLTATLFELEMKGVVKTFAGGIYHLLK